MTTTPVDNRLGKFWIRLAVKNLEASRAFYQKLGFEVVTGDGKTWQVVKNGDVTLSLIEGKFERSILTFNPGRDSQRERPSSFVDLRELHARAKAAGLVPSDETGLDGAGSGSFMLTDPDGNPVLFDRHE